MTVTAIVSVRPLRFSIRTVGDPFGLNGGQTSALPSAESELRTLGAQIQNTCYTTVAAFRSDATKVFVDYRVDWLREPQTHAIEAAGRLIAAHDSLTQIAARLASLVGTNADAQRDLAAMNDALNAAATKLATPPPRHVVDHRCCVLEACDRHDFG